MSVKSDVTDPYLKDPFYYATDSPPLPVPRRLDILKYDSELFPLAAFHQAGVRKLHEKFNLEKTKLAEDPSLTEESRWASLESIWKSEIVLLAKQQKAFLAQMYLLPGPVWASYLRS